MKPKHDIEDHREDQFAEYQKHLSGPDDDDNEEESVPLNLSKFDHLLDALDILEKKEII